MFMICDYLAVVDATMTREVEAHKTANECIRSDFNSKKLNSHQTTCNGRVGGASEHGCKSHRRKKSRRNGNKVRKRTT